MRAMTKLLCSALMLVLSFSFQQSVRVLAQDYTVSDVMAAYEAGQFRIIFTSSESLHSSPDAAYIAALSDGVYRVRDSQYFPQYDRVTFSPDGRYMANEHDAVYRVDDGHRLFDIGALPRFSPNSDYAAAPGYGLFRLSDGQKLFDIADSHVYTDGYVYSFYTVFSPNGDFIAIDDDGLYRLDDQRRIFALSGGAGFSVTFSQDEQYAALVDNGVYRLIDGVKLYDVDEFVSFSPDSRFFIAQDAIHDVTDGSMIVDFNWPENPLYGAWAWYSHYVAVSGDGIYNLETGQKLFSISNAAVFSPDGRFVAIENDALYTFPEGTRLFSIVGVRPQFSLNMAYLVTRSGREAGAGYRISDGLELFDVPYGVTFSPDGQYAAVGRNGVYRLHDNQRLFPLNGVNERFSEDAQYVMLTDGIYKMSDGRFYRGLKLLDVAAGIIQLGNTVFIIDPAYHQDTVPFVNIITGPLYPEPTLSTDGIRHINSDSNLAVLAERDGWYQVGYAGVIGWVPAQNATRFNIP